MIDANESYYYYLYSINLQRFVQIEEVDRHLKFLIESF